jgi:hypothetical protein
VVANTARSRGLRRLAGRQSTTTADPSPRRKKKSGACERDLPSPVIHNSQNGCEAIATTAGSKSNAAR